MHTKIAVLSVLFLVPSARADVLLTFDAPVPGTLQEQHGLGTGFTHRLPGTGFALPANDPNMDLLARPGHLKLRSTFADINQYPAPIGKNLGDLEAPGVVLNHVAGRDLAISALFRDVSVPHGSDQLMLYAGTSEVNILRVGFHELNVYLFCENQGFGDQNTVLSPFNAFATGDDIILTLTRTAGIWQLAWNNLTNPGASGISVGLPVPWLDGADTLHVGILAASAGTSLTFETAVDWFSVSVAEVPEPSTFSLVGVGAVGLLWLRRRQ